MLFGEIDLCLQVSRVSVLITQSLLVERFSSQGVASSSPGFL